MLDFNEVDKGFDIKKATEEAARCLNCKNAPCKGACPVSVLIPDFIQEIKNGNVDKAKEIIEETNSLGSVCGRVCPQEKQCQSVCVRGIKGEPIQIGQLERFVCDNGDNHPVRSASTPPKEGNLHVAIIGSGPAGLACAGELINNGVNVTIYEALHELGGVLSYGIPEFRLPKKIVQKEIKNLQNKSVRFITDVVVGKTITLQQLKEENDFVFIGTGAGLPLFLEISGEMLNGVYSSNEFLTRINLMHAGDFPNVDTPIKIGKKVAVIGGGNVAMDCARCAIRLGSDVALVYRRESTDLPARAEEVKHAVQEGMKVLELSIPQKIIGDENGKVIGLEVTKAVIGELDDKGRRSFNEIPNSAHVLDVDTVIIAIGQRPNPLLSKSDNSLEINEKGCIVTDKKGESVISSVYAGGDAVTGAATVILAMGAGRDAARAMLEKGRII